MGLIFRKSFKVGGARVNVSKSGISTSTGVKGARVGVGKRGVTTSVGADGVYYRKTYGSKSNNENDKDNEVNLTETLNIFKRSDIDKKNRWLKPYGLQYKIEYENVKVEKKGKLLLVLMLIGFVLLFCLPLIGVPLVLGTVLYSIPTILLYKKRYIKSVLIYEAEKEANKDIREQKAKQDAEEKERIERERQEKKIDKLNKEKDKMYKDVNKYLDKHDIKFNTIENEIKPKEIE